MTPGLGSTEVHRAAGGDFRLWDGSSRRIQASHDEGAAGVVATPLCAFDADLPESSPTPPNCYEEPLFMYDRQKGLLLELGCEALPCVGGDGEHDPVTILGVADGHPAVG